MDYKRDHLSYSSYFAYFLILYWFWFCCIEFAYFCLFDCMLLLVWLYVFVDLFVFKLEMPRPWWLQMKSKHFSKVFEVDSRSVENWQLGIRNDAEGKRKKGQLWVTNTGYWQTKFNLNQLMVRRMCYRKDIHLYC